MLRITIHYETAATRFIVEGRLTGPWAEELRRCWEDTEPGVPLPVELSALTVIDAAGETLLCEMHRHGVRFAAAGLRTQAILEETTS